jgi:hypothetical protein
LSPGRHCGGRVAKIARQMAICLPSGNRRPLRVAVRRGVGS